MELDKEIGRNTVFKGVLSLAPPQWQLANFGSRIVAYIICAETEMGWHFPVTYNYFYNSAMIILSDELIFLISDLLT